MIFLKFKRYIFSSPKFATIFSGIKELSVVVFLLFRFFTMYDFTVENGIPHFFRNILSCLSKSFYWMKPLYVIEEPPTRLYHSQEEQRLRNTLAKREKRKKLSSEDKDKLNLQDQERWCDCGPRVNEAKRLKRSLKPLCLFKSSFPSKKCQLRNKKEHV